MVSETIFGLAVGGGASALALVATAVYMNRRRINIMYQRLFGTDVDETDDGYLVEINEKIDDLSQQMEEDHGEVMRRLTED